MNSFSPVSSLADVKEEEKTPLAARGLPETTYHLLLASKAQYTNNIALRYLPTGAVRDEPKNYSFNKLFENVSRTANLLSRLGVSSDDAVSIVLPNCPEHHFVLWGAQAVGIANPINHYLEASTIAEIVEAAGSKVMVVLGPSHERDIWEKACLVASRIPTIECLIRVSIGEDSANDESIFAPEGVDVIDFSTSIEKESCAFICRKTGDDEAAYFHTGGTTGTPKLARLKHSNLVYMACCLAGQVDVCALDVALSGLPLFHVNAMFTGGLMNFYAGAETIILSPDGYRSKTVIANHWSVVELYKATHYSGVPTVHAALFDVSVDGADVSSLKAVICGAAPATQQLYSRAESILGLELLEGYGLTEGACVSSLQPLNGKRPHGSIGLSLPYQKMKCVKLDEKGLHAGDCKIGEVGDLLIKGPNVFIGYLQEENESIFMEDGWLITGDIARQDEDGYFWLTGRAKDLIIRGGHNICPSVIESALASHPCVSTVAAVGQPDDYAGELPCAYITLKNSSSVSVDELLNYARDNINERAAAPVFIEILSVIPVTAVGKIFKPELRRMAVERVINARVKDENIHCDVNVVLDPDKGIFIKVLADRDYDLAKELLASYPIKFDIHRIEINRNDSKG